MLPYLKTTLLYLPPYLHSCISFKYLNILLEQRWYANLTLSILFCVSVSDNEPKRFMLRNNHMNSCTLSAPQKYDLGQRNLNQNR